METLQPDLVITEIRMPGVDGLELAQRIPAQHPDMPVVAVSGHVGQVDLEDRGFIAFMDKPLKLVDFRQLVERTLAKH